MKKPKRTYRIYLSLHLATSHLCWALHGEGPHCLNASNHHGISWPNGLQQRKLRCHRPVQVLLARCEAYNIPKLKSRRKDLGRQLLICGSLLFSLDFTRQTKTKTKHIINQLQSQLQHFKFLYKLLNFWYINTNYTCAVRRVSKGCVAVRPEVWGLPAISHAPYLGLCERMVENGGQKPWRVGWRANLKIA